MAKLFSHPGIWITTSNPNQFQLNIGKKGKRFYSQPNDVHIITYWTPPIKTPLNPDYPAQELEGHVVKGVRDPADLAAMAAWIADRKMKKPKVLIIEKRLDVILRFATDEDATAFRDQWADKLV